MQVLHLRTNKPLAAFLAIAFCAIGLCAAYADQANAAGRYVAFGDSSSTGSGLDGSNTAPGSPPLCNQTVKGYPTFVAEQLGFSDFKSAACSSAGIREFTTDQPLYQWPSTTPSAYAPPQFNSLTGTETLVTISIGANDSGYGTYTGNCLDNTDPNATPCRDKYVVNGVNTLVTSAQQGVTNRLGPAIDQIHARSPNAEVWVIGYARLIPVDVSTCVGKIGVSAGDAPVFNAWQVALNDYSRAETEAHDAYYVDVFTPSAGHDGCQPNAADRWSNPGQSATTSGLSLHPTLAGEQAVAQLFVNAFHSPRPIRGTPQTGQTLGIKFRLKKIRSVASRLAPITTKRPKKHGAKLAVTLARSGSVEFFIDRAKPGRIKNGKCRSMSKRAGRGRKACARYVRVPTSVTLTLPGGSSTVYFTGRARGKRLAVGTYRLRAAIGALSAKTPAFKLSK